MIGYGIIRNKYNFNPYYDLKKINKIHLTKQFIFEGNINFNQGEDYFIVEQDEQNFKLYKGIEFVCNGKYYQNFEME